MVDSALVPSPNFTPGRLGDAPKMVVIHHSECLAPECDAIFTNPDPGQHGGRRSAHYLVCRDGSVRHYVHESDTAWHAGNWRANLESVGIEFEEVGDDFTDVQYQAGAVLIQDIAARWGFAVSDSTVLPHRHFSATACPGGLNVSKLTSPRTAAPATAPDSPVTPGIPAQETSAQVTVHSFPKRVNVLVPLKVRSDPSLSARTVPQPTPNGVLNPPYSFEAQDAVRGQEYSIKGVTGSLWLKTPLGRWVAAGGTDYQPNQTSNT